MSLFDLICIGVGGTVGSGIFVLCGLIARDYTGPSVIFSWMIAGVGCMASALSYAELSCIIPSAGSSYAYVYVGLGELPAFLSAWCLTLEYGISGAAVASSWGNKVQEWIDSLPTNQITLNYSFYGIQLNLLGGLLQLLVVFMLLAGVDVSKRIVNSFTILKMLLVVFIILAGLSLYNSNNITTWIPFGVPGIFRGAASCFFGYVGYDEVCCMAAEAKDPQRVLPLAVLGTIAIVTVFYTLAALALIGMQNYQSINIDSGFSNAFGSNNWLWAEQLVAIGEIVTLPLVVLVSFLAQPRLLYALAEDGLLPKRLCDLDNGGNMKNGIVVSGIVCTLITIFIPFTYLDDIISAGVLLSFTLTNTSLLSIRYNNDLNSSRVRVNTDNRLSITKEKSSNMYYHISLFVYNVIAIILCNIVTSFDTYQYSYNMMIVMLLLISILIVSLIITVRKIIILYNDNLSIYPTTALHFQVPYVPQIPLLGILINYYLIAQLSWEGIIGVIMYFILAIGIYYSYSKNHSIGNNQGWDLNIDNFDILDSSINKNKSTGYSVLHNSIDDSNISDYSK